MNKIGFSDSMDIFRDKPQEQEEIREIPQKFIILKLGKNMFTIDDSQGEFDVDDDQAKRIVEEFNTRGKDLVADYDHATLNKEAASIGDAPAAGWINQLEYDPECGIVAIVKKWTPKAQERMKNGEYRYFSPVINFDPEKLKENQLIANSIHSVALTNHPAIHSPDALIAAHDTTSPKKEDKKIASHQQLLKLCHDTIAINQEIMQRELNDYKRYVSGKPSLEQGLTAFSDSIFGFNCGSSNKIKMADDNQDSQELFGDEVPTEDATMNTVEAPAVANEGAAQEEDISAKIDSILGEINNAKATMPIKDYYDFLKSKEASVPEEAIKRILQAAINDAQNQLNQVNESVIPTPSAMQVASNNATMPTETALMNDLGGILGLKSANKEDILNEVKALCDIKNKSEGILKSLNMKSFSDTEFETVLSKRDIAKQTSSLAKIAELEKKIALNDVSKKIDDMVSKGQIVNSQRDSLLALAEKDMTAFNDFTKTLPTVFKGSMAAFNCKTTATSKPKKSFTDEQLQVFEMMGVSPEEMMNEKPKDKSC